MNCYELHFVHLILKAKNLMRKTSGNVFSSFKGSRRIFVNHITIFNSSAMEHLRWSYLWQKTGKGWNLCWLLLCCYIFKISNSPHPPKKTKTKKNNKKKQTKKTKKNTRTSIFTCQVYLQLTIKTPEQHVAPLLLTLNIFFTLFCCYHCWIQINTGWALKIIVSDNKFAFSNCDKYIVL